MEQINNALQYVSQAQLFWSSLGFTTSIGIFVGALLFDGHLKKVSKGIISILAYAFLVITTVYNRISSHLATHADHEMDVLTLQWINLGTILFITLAYCGGMLAGVFLIWYHKNHK